MSCGAGLNVDGWKEMAAGELLVPVVFIVFAVVGNLALIVVVAVYRKMRCTSNILLASLAGVDLLYVVTCLPFVTYANLARDWLFGNAWCMVCRSLLILSCPKLSVSTCLSLLMVVLVSSLFVCLFVNRKGSNSKSYCRIFESLGK